MHVYEIPFTWVDQYIVYTQTSRCESVYALLHSWCVHNVYVHMFVSHMLEPQIHVQIMMPFCVKKSHIMFGTNFHTGV